MHAVDIIMPSLCCVCVVSAWCLQPKDWSISMNKKERRLALATALQSAAGDVVVVDDIKQAAGAQQMLGETGQQQYQHTVVNGSREKQHSTPHPTASQSSTTATNPVDCRALRYPGAAQCRV
jgi:ribosomal protein L4